MSKQAPSINKLDDYIGAFYEDAIQIKVQTSKTILELFRDFNNLQILLQHDSLLPLLSRTLTENHKRSIDLSVYLLSTFYILSNYKQFQDMLTENKIGATIIEILENQIQRFDLMYSQYIQMWRKNNQNDRLTAKSQLKKLNILIWKQDKLFYVCLNILFNISYNPAIEKKMRKAGLVQILCRCLQRNDFHLLIITLIFIKKISVMGEYKQQLLGVGIIQKLQRFFSCQNDILLNFALLIYYNLSFDKIARSSIQKASLIPKFVHLMAQDSPNRMTALNILYLLSTDTGIRYTLAYTNCMDYVIKLILFPNPSINAIQLFSLAINLAANQRNVQHISSQDFFKILDKSLKSEDPTMLKFCKCFLRSSKNQQIMSNMKIYLKDKIIKLIMTKSKNNQMCLQLLGIMSNCKINTQWTDVLISNDKFLDFLQKSMLNGVTQDDILMEILALTSNICKEAQCCNLIERLFSPVLALFLRDQYDPQFISQVLYTIYCFIFHFVGLDYILNDGQVLMRILQLIEDPNEGVRQTNDLVLTILRQTEDVQLNENIKQSKFYQHNKRWLTQTQGIHDWVYNNPYDYNQQMLDPRMWQSEDDYDQ